MKMSITLSLFFIFNFVLCAFGESEGRNDRFFLFNIVKFDNDICQGNNDNDIGVCFTKSECTARDGRESGNCASGFGVCCIIESNCNSTNHPSEIVQYFQSPNYPQIDSMPYYCSRNIKIVNTDICQVRIDFLEFEMGGPSMRQAPFGQCLNDRMSLFFGNTRLGLSGGNSLCGNMKGQHIYIDVSETTDESLRFFTMVGNEDDIPGSTISPLASTQYKWNLRIRQISCSDYSDVRAPEGCLQYFPSPMGTIESFNYGAVNSPYPALLDYTMCFKKLKGFCGISFQVIGEGNGSPVFGLNYNGDGSVPYGEFCYGTPGASSNDFLEVLAGSYKNLGATDFTTTSHICGVKKDRFVPVFRSTYPGPWMIRFKSDESLRILGGTDTVNTVNEADTLVGAGGETGFRLKYRLIQNC